MYYWDVQECWILSPFALRWLLVMMITFYQVFVFALDSLSANQTSPGNVYITYLAHNYKHCFQVCFSKYATLTKCAPCLKQIWHNENTFMKWTSNVNTINPLLTPPPPPQISSPFPSPLSRMVHSPTGSSDLFMILGFSTLYSSSLWRTDTIVFAQSNKLPLSKKPPLPTLKCVWN